MIDLNIGITQHFHGCQNYLEYFNTVDLCQIIQKIFSFTKEFLLDAGLPLNRTMLIDSFEYGMEAQVILYHIEVIEYGFTTFQNRQPLKMKFQSTQKLILNVPATFDNNTLKMCFNIYYARMILFAYGSISNQNRR